MKPYTSPKTPTKYNNEAIKALAAEYGVTVELIKGKGWYVTQNEFCDHAPLIGDTKMGAWYGLCSLLKYWTDEIINPGLETDARIANEKALEAAIIAELNDMDFTSAIHIAAFDAKLSVDLREDFLDEMVKAGLLEGFESKGGTYRAWRLKRPENDLQTDILDQLAVMHENGIGKVQAEDIPALRRFTNWDRLSNMERLEARGFVERISVGGEVAWFIAKKSKRAAVLAELRTRDGWATPDEVKALEGLNPDHKVPFLREMVMDGLLVMTLFGKPQTLCFGYGITF